MREYVHPTRFLVVAALGSLLACSSSDRPRASTPPLGDSGATPDAPSGDDAAGGEGGSAPDGASSHDGGAEASSDAAPPLDSGDAGDGAYVPPPSTALCDRAATWAPGTALAVSTPDDDLLGAITPDELTIAWTVGTGSGATIEYADRAAGTDPFGAAQSLAAGAFAADRVALSPDGLRLVVVNADAQGFSELTRTARTGAGNTFMGASVGLYSNLDGALASGQSYGDPVLGADDRVFYYSIYGGGLTGTIFRSVRLFAGDAWPPGGALAASSGLAAQGSMRRRPTAIASDEQTLFFWDEVSGTERAGWLNDSTGAYDSFVDLGARKYAVPNQLCTQLYYSATGASSVDLLVAGH